MSNLITEIYDKQAVVDNLNQLGELINSSLNAIVASAPKLQSPIEYLTAVQSISEIEKKNTEVTQAKAKAMSDLDKAYQQADKALQEAINLQDEEMQKQIKLSSSYKELSKEQKKLIEIERTRQQTIQYSDKLLQEEAKSEAELRLQQQQLIKAHQSLRVTNEDENRLREQIIAKINANKEALKGMTDEVSKQRDNVGNYKSALEGLAAGALPSMGAAMKVVRTELMQLEALMANGTELTADQKKRYDELNNELAAMVDIQGDVSARSKALSNDYLGINTALEGMKLGANSLSAVQSATAMLGVEDEKLVATIQKVQAAQAFANSVNEIANSLNKDSALVQGLQNIKEKLLTTAIGEQTKAQLALNAAKLGFIGLAAAAVTGLVIWIAKMASAKNEVADLTKSINEQAVDAVAPLVQKVTTLKDEWDNLGGNLEAQKQFIKDNAGAFDELGISLTNVNDAEKFFSEQTQNFIDAQINRAKAEAARAQMTEIVKQQLTAQLEYERRYVNDQKTMWESVVDGYNKMQMGAAEYALMQKIAAEQEKQQYDDQIKSLSEMATGFDEIANKLTANIPLHDKNTNAVKNQTQANKDLKLSLEELQEQEEEWAKAQLNDIFKNTTKNLTEQTEATAKLIDEKRKLRDEAVNSIEIEEEEAEAIETLTERTKRLAKEQAETSKMRKEAYDDMVSNVGSAFDDLLGYIDQQKEADQDWYDYQKELIENGIHDEELREARLASLDAEKLKRDKETAKKEAEIKRRQAIFQNAVDAAAAMSKAVESVGKLLETSAGGDTYSAVARYIAAIAAGVAAVSTVATLINRLLTIPQFAKGGTAEANKPFIAGEKGREIGFGLRTGKVYDFSKPTLFKANEPINIKNATETRQIINNNEYNKDVTLHNEVVVQVIDNKRIERYFKI